MQRQLSQFAACLWEPMDLIETRCLMNGDAEQEWLYVHELPGRADKLLELNRAGWNCYCGAAPRPRAGASGDENIELCRTLFADFDQKHFPAGCTDQEEYVETKVQEVGLPTPTMTVNSGHGIHCYFRLEEPLDPGRWKVGNRRLSELLGSDPSISNPERIMRLAGTMNNKPPAAPCRIIEADCMRRYPLAAFAALRAAPEPEPVPQTASIPIPTTDAAARAAAYAQTWEPLREGDCRNQAMYIHVKALVNDMQIPLDIARQTVGEWNRLNIPPMDDREFDQTFESALKYANKQVAGCKNDAEPKIVKLAPPTDDPAKGLEQLLEDNISGKRTSIPWPWPILDIYMQALLPGRLCLLCGAEGSTKSYMILEAAAFWHLSGVKVAVLEGEEERAYHLNRCLAQLSEESRLMNAVWCRNNPEETRAHFANHRQFISDFGNFVHDNQRQLLSLPDIVEWARARAKEGCRIIAIDPVTGADRQGRRETDDDKRFIHACQSIATEYDCSIICVTHPTKAWAEPETGQIAGGASYARFFQSIIWLESHGDREEDWPTHRVALSCGTVELAHSRTLRLLKSRDTGSKGFRVACNFDRHNLRLRVEGLIIKDKSKA